MTLVISLGLALSLLTLGGGFENAITAGTEGRVAHYGRSLPQLASRHEAVSFLLGTARKVLYGATHQADTLAYPLRRASVLDASTEPVQRVAGARIVHADYALLRADFEHLRKLTDEQIDAWLLEQSGYISTPQAEQAVVNAPIVTTGQTREALRPPYYGRGLVFEVEGGLLEGKGFGALEPKPGGHSDGLVRLDELIREWQFMDMVSLTLEDAQSPYSVVRPYALIDWGFDAERLGGEGRAGAMLRQAHARFPSVYASKSAHLVDDEHALAVERTLRRYGVSTTGAHRGSEVLREANLAKLNVQADITQRRLVDFASWMVFDDSLEPRQLRNFWSEQILAHEADPDMHADPTRRIRTERFFGPVRKDEGVLADQTWIDATWLARALRSSEIEPARLSEHFRVSRAWVRESLVSPND